MTGRRLRAVAAAVACLAPVGPLVAQVTCETVVSQLAADVVRHAKASPARESRVRILLGAPEAITPCLKADPSLKEKLAQVLELKRIDKQTGTANSGAAGSTSLVSSGAAPRLLGLAVEHGAIAQAMAGSTVTFRTTPAKLLNALAKAQGPSAPLPDDRTLRALGKVSASVSFDTTRTASAAAPNGSPFQANYRQLSEATLRVQLLNDRDPLSHQNFDRIQQFSQGPSAKLYANEALSFMKAMKAHPDFATLRDRTAQALRDASDETAAAEAWREYIAGLQAIFDTQPDAADRLRRFVDRWVSVDEDHRALYRQIAKAPMLAFEYAFERPPLIKPEAATTVAIAPDHHTARLIYVASLLEAEYTLTASATWFHEARPEMSGNFRSFQLGGKIDVPLGRLSPIARGQLTFSGLLAHLHQRPLGFDLRINDEKVNKPGSIGFFQARYSIPLSDNGVSIPISLTFSNRTELIKEREIRGNIGLSFDLDKLLAGRPNQ